MAALAVLTVTGVLASSDEASTPGPGRDRRLIDTGRPIPTESYADQPYVVQTDDGAWLTVMTSGSGREGDPGQTVITMRSIDRGVSWSERVALEPTDGPEASYAVLLKAPGGRIFCFYNHNTDDVRRGRGREVPVVAGTGSSTASTHWATTSTSTPTTTVAPGRPSGTPIPQRLFQIDQENPYEGRILFFWNVGRPFVDRGRACVPLHKVGAFGHGFMARSEGVLLCSPDLLTLPDPRAATWETLPDGEVGLRTPPGGGPIAEEQSFSPLSDGSLFVVYRSIDGHPVHAYSRDGGRTWTGVPRLPALRQRPARQAPARRELRLAVPEREVPLLVSQSRRALVRGPKPGLDRRRRGDRTRRTAESSPGASRRFSSTTNDPYVRMSYPDLIEDDGRTFVTETQKHLARVHEIDPTLLELLWEQPSRSELTRDGLVAEWSRASSPTTIELPSWPVHVDRDPDAPDGRTRDLRAGVHPGSAHQVRLDVRDHLVGHTLERWSRPGGDPHARADDPLRHERRANRGVPGRATPGSSRPPDRITSASSSTVAPS